MCITNNNVKICVKHDCEYTKKGTSNNYHCRQCYNETSRIRNANPEQRAKKREWDNKYQTKKRIENPVALKQAQEKHKQTDKYRDRKILALFITSSNIYCTICNNNRIHGDNYCSCCQTKIKYFKAYNFISNCKNCNKAFGIDIKLRNIGLVFQLNNYCSLTCNTELIKINKKINKKIYQNKNKQIKNDKQNAKKYGNKYEVVNRKIVYRKHNYVCTSCNVKCVYPTKENYNQSNAATLDHIIPKSKGGSHTYNNVTLLCRSCNTNKSDKILTDYKRNESQLELQFIDYIPQGTQLQLQMT